MSKRARNYTEREKHEFLNVIEKYINIIENKKSDGTNLKVKKEAWQNIANEFNAISEANRTPDQLLALYKNIKQRSRQKLQNDKMESYKTGGGTFIPSVTAVGEKLIGMLSEHFQPLANPFDRSSTYYGEQSSALSNEPASPNVSKLEVPVMIEDMSDESFHPLSQPSSPSSESPVEIQKKIKLDPFTLQKKELILESLKLDVEIKRRTLCLLDLEISLKKKQLENK